MQTVINAKTLRSQLAAVLERVRQGESITVIYRSRPVCRLVPLEGPEQPPGRTEDDPLYQAEAVGRSHDGLRASDHDAVLYGGSRG
jgi:prevent-host-death family protein